MEFFGNNTIGFFGFSFPAESGIAISLFRPETEKAIDPINPTCPVAPEDGTGMNPVQLPKFKLRRTHKFV